MCLASAVACALSMSTASVLACGAPPPQQPPPPPPVPPIVCCVVVDWFLLPNDPDCEYLLLRYFRQDGIPLYQSNPMMLFPNQQCLCSLPPFPPTPPGVQVLGFSFGDPNILPWQGLPMNQPGYGPFQQVANTSIISQVSNFNQVYANAAGDLVELPGPPQVFGFGGPGQIFPNVVFDIFQLVKIPRGMDPRVLCPFAGAMGSLSLYLSQDGQVLVEPIMPGLPPIPFNQFIQNPGNSAFYKFKWYPLIIPPPCPPVGNTCPGDIDGDGDRDFADLNIMLSFYNIPCP
jgi:hypothetical protein